MRFTVLGATITLLLGLAWVGVGLVGVRYATQGALAGVHDFNCDNRLSPNRERPCESNGFYREPSSLIALNRLRQGGKRHNGDDRIDGGGVKDQCCESGHRVFGQHAYREGLEPPWPLGYFHPLIVSVVAGLAVILGAFFALAAFGNVGGWGMCALLLASVASAQFGVRAAIALIVR